MICKKKGNLFFPRGHDAGSSLGPRRRSWRPPTHVRPRGLEIPVGGRSLSGPRSGHSVQCSALAESSVPRTDWLLGVRWWCWARGANEHRAPSAAADLYALAGSGLQPAPKALYVGRPLLAAHCSTTHQLPTWGQIALDCQSFDLTCNCDVQRGRCLPLRVRGGPDITPTTSLGSHGADGAPY